MKRTWFIYRVDSLSLKGWTKFGIKGEHVTESRDMTVMARAVSLLADCVPEVDWYDGWHEFWVLEAPCAPPFVAIRPGANPFDAGYIVSALPMPHLKVEANKDGNGAAWEREHS